MPRTRRKYVDELLAELQSLGMAGSASKLKNTIDKLGNLTDRKVIPSIMPYLDHETDYVRASVVYALEKIRPKKDLPSILLKRLESESSELVRGAIIETLGIIGDDSVIDALEQIRDSKNEDEKIKIMAIFSIDRLSGDREYTLDQLVDYLFDATNPNIRVEAAKTLGKLGDPRAIDYLIDALDDEKVFVRKFVIKALISFRDKRVVDPIISAFKDEVVFLDREFTEVLWAFPEYKNKHLWEIIELRAKERLNEVTIDDKILQKSESSSIKDDYLYESQICQDQEDGELNSQEKTSNHQAKPCSTGQIKAGIQKEQEKNPKTFELPENKNDEDESLRLKKVKQFSKLFNRGERYFRKKKYFDALVNFKKALEIKYDAWQVWYNMALVFYDVDEMEKCIECFKNSLRFKPNEIDTLLNLASLHLEIGDYIKSVQYFLIALKNDKYITDAWMMLGKVFYKLKKLEYAYFCFEQVLKTSNDKRERKEALEFTLQLIERQKDIRAMDPRKGISDIESDDFKLDF